MQVPGRLPVVGLLIRLHLHVKGHAVVHEARVEHGHVPEGVQQVRGGVGLRGDTGGEGFAGGPARGERPGEAAECHVAAVGAEPQGVSPAAEAVLLLEALADHLHHLVGHLRGGGAGVGAELTHLPPHHIAEGGVALEVAPQGPL